MKIPKSVHLFTCLLWAIGIGIYALLKPEYNWDMLGYIATAVSYDQEDPQILHQETYAAVKRSVPPEKYDELVSSKSGYREKMASDANSFVTQIPFYSIRPLYTILIYALHKIGIELATATVLISAISGMGISVFFFLWALKYIDSFFALLFTCLMGIGVGIPVVERLSTPDALSSLILVVSFFLLIEKKQTILSYILMSLSLFSRPDNIVIMLLLVVYSLFRKDQEYLLTFRQFSLLVLIIFSIYFGINYLTGNYGFKTLLTHVFVQRLTNPLEQHLSISTTDYLRALLKGIKRCLFDPYSYFVPLFLLLGLAAFYLNRFRRSAENFGMHFTLLMMLGIVIHFTLYPLPDGRFFVSQGIVISVMLLRTVQDLSIRQSCR